MNITITVWRLRIAEIDVNCTQLFALLTAPGANGTTPAKRAAGWLSTQWINHHQ